MKLKVFSVFFLSASLGMTQLPVMSATTDDCLLRAIQNADDSATVGSLRQQCSDQITASETTVPETDKETQIDRYLRSDTDASTRNYLISVHKPNYILPYTNNSDLNLEPWEDNVSPENLAALSDTEAIFQVSAKLPVWRNMFSQDMDLYFAYTQKSWWQVYTDEADLSAPFRETNYEPELFARYFGGPKLGAGGRVSAIDVGYVHQSNGRSDVGDGAINRSWDRLMARAVLDWDEFAVILRGWAVLDESDDNENLYQYMGYGDIRAQWAPNKNTFGLMVRPGTEKMGVEASWSWQLTDTFRLYTQYYKGYGESLLDYNAKTSRIGIGIMFNDYLMNE
jgi:phospholipase A1